MELREGYKKTEIGIIPEDWKCLQIREFTGVKAGGTPSTFIKEYWGGNIKWMNSGELNNKRIYDVEGRITEEGLYNSSTSIVPAASVLIGLAGQGKTRGTVAINYIDLCTNQSIAAILPNKTIKSEFLYQYLNSKYKYIRELSSGDGGRGGLNLKIINAIAIPVPPLPEQQAIASALSDIDNLISSLTKLIAKKENIKQGTMQELLTGKKRLEGFSGAWVRKAVSDFGAVITGNTPSTFNEKYWGGHIPWITPTDIERNKDIYTSERKLTEFGFEKTRKLGANTVLITCIASIGKNAVLRKAGACNQQINAIMPSKDYNSDFLYYLFELNKQHLLSRAGITATSIISKSEFCLIEFLVPKTFKEQTAIANILSDMDAEIEALEQKLDKYRAIKQGMMEELLTGRIRLI